MYPPPLPPQAILGAYIYARYDFEPGEQVTTGAQSSG